MTILLAASEMDPLARTGGLGDVIEAFPAALKGRGHEVSVVLPLYRSIREQAGLAIRPTGVEFPIQLGPKRLTASVHECVAPNGIQVFLIRCDEYFDRNGIYGEDGQGYEDNAERFIFFSKAVIELARRLLPPPDVIHAHDWQTALIPVLVKQRRLPFKTVMTIHNLAYQGSFWAFDFGLTGLPGDYFAAGQGLEFYGNINLLKGGIAYADAVTTVSERYAREIQTPEYGAGLDPIIVSNAHKFTGILNGADYGIWNPESDRLLPQNYSAENLAGKQACKAALLNQLGLEPNPTGPVYSLVSRLASQKGIDLLLPLIDRLLSDDARLIVIGAGDPAYERDLLIASKQHPERLCYRKETDAQLSHLTEGGADISLIPSHYEPCGLTAMYGLKYGTLPIARATGGLHEIIQDIDPSTNSGNGFLFFEATSEAFWDAIVRARMTFRDTPRWHELMRRAMAAEFSWTRAVDRYEEVYRRILGRKK
jgi:starch synthase